MAKRKTSYSDAIKAEIYEALLKQDLRFNELAKTIGRDHMTLSRYLHHAEESGEVVKTGKTRRSPYSLTPKGQETLQRIVEAQIASKQPILLHGEVNSDGYLQPSDLAGSFSESTMPLPLPVDVTMYGTEELRSYFPIRTMDILIDKHLVGPKNAPKTTLKLVTGEWAMNFVWTQILTRLMRLYQLHHNYGKKTKNVLIITDTKGSILGYHYDENEGARPPPALTLDNILGFDATLTIRYEGRKLMKSPDLQEIHRASRRLVGALLLRLAGGWFFGWHPRSISTPISLLERGGLLESKDAEELRLTLAHEKPVRSWFEARWRPSKAARAAILEIACKYLKEGGVLMAKDTAPRSHVTRRFHIAPRNRGTHDQRQGDPFT